MRTIQEIEERLSAQTDKSNFPYPIKDMNGFDYISWQDTVRQLNSVFGFTGWSSEVREFNEITTENGRGFKCLVRLTCNARDEDGGIIIFHRDGVGFSDIRTTGNGVDLVDTAVKAAESDALSRAAKKLGDAFGLFLYDKKESSNSSGGSKSTNSASSDPVTEGQKKMLAYQKVPEQIVVQLNKRTASQLISDIKDGKKREEIFAPYQKQEPSKTDYAWDDKVA
jgi:recombination DNA repair RAD52 pathway protein